MDFGLKEIGITFMIGAFTILGIELVLYYLSGMVITGFFRDRLGLDGETVTSSPKRMRGRRRRDTRLGLNGETGTSPPAVGDAVQNMRLAVFIGLSFGVGILAEDVSYKFVDNELPFGLESKYDTRLKVLVEESPELKFSHLAKDLATNAAFLRIDAERGAELNEWVKTDGKCEKCGALGIDEVKSAIVKLYYHAKNRVYLQANYYDEMRKIQSRADFARSIAVISFINVAMFFGIMIVMCIDKHLMKNRIINFMRERLGAKPFASLRAVEYQKAAATFVTLLAVLALSSWAYDKESREYNKRAFGYYSTSLQAGGKN
ncbi:MAG: hypothetical protein IPN69_02715 [Acidobacteria bacterium]|nr:hypothetical protein [Acidobacteriota bacterium]MBK8809626.1 hypothetical protein [Acidobacteriota bacterium]